MSSIRYRPEVDGLRALAIVPVIFFHLCPSWLPGGFVGVDVFFVISGYLITSIILKELSADTFNFFSFWARRVRRIFPALAVMIALVSAFAVLAGLPSLTSEVGKEGLAASVGLGNYRMLTVTSDYWGAQAERIPLLHTWSLGVEEQFYLIFPIFLWLVARFFRTKLVACLVVLGFASCAWCAYRTGVAQSQAFFLMAPRGWELILGALIAVGGYQTLEIPLHWRTALAALGLAMIVVAFFVTSPSMGFPWPAASMPCVGTALCILCANGSDPISRIMGARLPVLIGKASYSLYLWHWPALVFGLYLATALEMPMLRPACLLAGIACGIISYRAIEPIGRRADFLKKWAPAMAFITIGLSSLLAFRTPLMTNGPYVHAEWQGGYYDSRSNAGIRPVHLGSYASPKLDLVLLGDSHALSLAPALNEMLAGQRRAGAVYASGGTRITSWSPTQHDMPVELRSDFERRRNQTIIESQPAVIVLCARWETFDRVDGLSSVTEFILELLAMSPDSRILIISQPPHLNFGNMKAYEWLNWRARLGVAGSSIRIQSNSAFGSAQEHLANLCRGDTRLTFVDLTAAFPVAEGRCDIFSEQDGVLYDDDDHLSLAGARRVVALFANKLSQR